MNNGTLRLNQASLTLHTLFFLLPSFFKTVKAAANRRDYGVKRTLGILVNFLHKLSENIGHNELPSSQGSPLQLCWPQDSGRGSQTLWSKSARNLSGHHI